MTRADLLALADRVEREEPSEWLDGDIRTAVGYAPGQAWEAYTASLDAAASLVPEGWVVYDIMQSINEPWYVSLWSKDPSVIGLVEGNAPDEPRARTAAALRARAQEMGDE